MSVLLQILLLFQLTNVPPEDPSLITKPGVFDTIEINAKLTNSLESASVYIYEESGKTDQLRNSSTETPQKDDITLRAYLVNAEQRTPFRFLYRDALIAGISVKSHDFDEDYAWIEYLSDFLKKHNIGVHVDFRRNQIILYEISTIGGGIAGRNALRNPDFSASFLMQAVEGQVVDAKTGTPLAYATVSWHEKDVLKGVVTDNDGRFRIASQTAGRIDNYQIQINYLGYKSLKIHVNGAAPTSEITIRLEPDPILAGAILVNSTTFRLATDTLLTRFSRFGKFGSFGEGSAVRTLQPLASVSLGGAINNGLHVRGSTSDAMQVLLDNVPVYSQNHLFGLFDPFNRDALHSVGFYYDVAPASFSGPPGATLAYSTRAGSQTGMQYSAGISNSAVRGTVEGPVRQGRGSWLVSGRHSYLTGLDWFNNQKLISWGLNVDRETEPIDPTFTDISAETIFPRNSEAVFYDLHGSFLYESRNSGNWTANIYLGGDRTYQLAERLQRDIPGMGDTFSELSLGAVETENEWGNMVISLRNRLILSEQRVLNSQISMSKYNASFRKDDFLYVRFLPQLNQVRAFFGGFSQENELLHMNVNQKLTGFDSRGNRIETGYSISLMDKVYEETSAVRPAYDLQTTGVLSDIFAQYDVNHLEWVHVFSGLRLHYYTLGNYWRLSPRILMRLLPEQRVQIGFGYSKNHQFLHSVSLKNISSAQIWVSSLSSQRPSESDNFTAGIYATPWRGAYFQVEGYYKKQRYVRIHEVNNTLISSTAGFIESPWFATSELLSRGIETQLLQQFLFFTWSGSYTYSISEMKNPFLNNGDVFYVDWDRRHQFFTGLTTSPIRGFSLHLSAVYASGVPHYALQDAIIREERLSDYHRIDGGISYQFARGNNVLSASVNVFNLTNRKNVWYRGPVMVADQSVRPVRLDFVDLDVYDLGFLPSFDVSVRF